MSESQQFFSYLNAILKGVAIAFCLAILIVGYIWIRDAIGLWIWEYRMNKEHKRIMKADAEEEKKPVEQRKPKAMQWGPHKFSVKIKEEHESKP